MNNLSENQIASVGLSNVQRRRYGGLMQDIFIADYVYDKSQAVIARYVFIECTYQEFEELFCRNSNFCEEVIQDIFFECFNTDLCWNIYQVCVMTGQEYRRISKEEILIYEADTDFTRKLLISCEEFENAIPVGKVRIGYESVKGKKISPKDEWYKQLESMGLGFCGEEYVEERLEEYLETGNWEKNIDKNQKLHKRNNLNNILSIFIPSSFRKNCFAKEERFEFGKVNMIAGKNGSGKTSVLEGIELVITGTVKKAMGIYKRYREVPEIYCVIDNGKKIKKPDNSKEVFRRAKTWYHKNDKAEENLNSDFHLYNYFTAMDTFILSYLGDKENLSCQFFQVLFGEETLNYYENIEKHIENIELLIKATEKYLQDMGKFVSSKSFVEDIKHAEKIFHENAEKYFMKFNKNWTIKDIAEYIKNCINLAEAINDDSALLLYTDLSKDLENIMEGKRYINEVKDTLKEKKEKLGKNGYSLKLDREIETLSRELEFKIFAVDKYEKTMQKTEKINELYKEIGKTIYIRREQTKVGDVINACHELDKLLKEWYAAHEKNSSLEMNIIKNEKKLKILRHIKKQLSSLKKPEEFLKEYVGNNIKQISDLFLQLQSPKEFDGLTFTQKAELVGVRDKEAIPLHMMSSGQRAAAVMALFFCVHLSADCIPKIILLDEPISHIDELNILSLFDLLRELVIRYDRQLFFTTSTREIERLFERKFSFLGEDFKGFHFERKGTGRTEIKWKSNEYEVTSRQKEGKLN